MKYLSRVTLLVLVSGLIGIGLPSVASAQSEIGDSNDYPRIALEFSELPPEPPSAGDESAGLEQRLKQLEQEWAAQRKADQAKKTADAQKPTVKWTGQLQSDFYLFNQDDDSRATFGDIENGEAFRRARFGMFGDYGPTEYRIEMDFALAGRPSFMDVFAGIHDVPGLGRVRVGHFFEPFSLERLTANRFTTFMERSLPDQPFVPARNLGVMANNTFADEHATWAVGFFRSDSDVFGDDVGDNFESAVTGRVTSLLCCDEESGAHYFHVGAGYSFRGANNETVRFRSQPEARIGSSVPNVPFFVDTGNIQADFYQLLGAEAAWVNGPFSLQSEFVLVPVHATAQDELLFHAWYATASYFLTGEHRPYRKDNGTFDRVIPHRDFVRYASDKCLEMGPGAWEIALRISRLDLNDQLVSGGRLTDLTVGLNWYMNPYLRMTANYVRAFADSPSGRDSGTDIFAMRVGFDF